jgi:chemotaxis protein MotB
MSGRRRKGHAEEHHVDERWLVSYSDMITVLMALFIVLYALSTVNQKKYDELKNSLASGFGVTKSEKVDESKGIVRKQDVKKDGSGFSNSTIALMQTAKEITDELKSAGIANKVSVKAGAKSITLSLVGSSAYFGGNDADLSPSALHTLHQLSPTLKKHAGTVTIEGHADPHGSAGIWQNDWNLASARANSVLQYMVSNKAIDPADISSISYGSEHAKSGTSEAAIEHNRRVDIVLHSVQPDAAAVTTTSTTADTAADAKKPASTTKSSGTTTKPTTSATAKASQ